MVWFGDCGVSLNSRLYRVYTVSFYPSYPFCEQQCRTSLPFLSPTQIFQRSSIFLFSSKENRHHH